MTGFAEEYGPHAFDGCLGQRVPLTDRPGGDVIGSAAVTSTDGGLAVDCTLEMTADGGLAAECALEAGAEFSAAGSMPAIHDMSFAFRLPEELPRDALAAGELKIRWACSGRPEDSP